MVVCGAAILLMIIMRAAGYIKKRTFVILLLASILCFAAAALNEARIEENEIHSLEKKEAGAGSSDEELIAVFEDGEEAKITIELPESTMSQAETEALLDEEYQRLESVILGENSSFSEIDSDMYLPAYGENNSVQIEWYSSRPEVISSEGVIGDGATEDGERVILIAFLSLNGEELEFKKEITVYAVEKTVSLEERLTAAVTEANEDNDTNIYILPESLDGEKIRWYRTSENTPALMAGLLVFIAALLHINARQKAEEEKKRRREALKYGYPELINRLLLLLYAGTGVRTAFYKIAESYQQEKKRSGICSEVFEEVTNACREMERGVYEDEAYENMAERCIEPCYRKLSVMLIQNRKYGGTGFIDALGQEAALALAEKKRRVEAYGETAAVRLLIPLGMMLTVVLAIMLIPAFLSI